MLSPVTKMTTMCAHCGGVHTNFQIVEDCRQVHPKNMKENKITVKFHISCLQGFQIQSRGWKRQVLD